MLSALVRNRSSGFKRCSIPGWGKGEELGFGSTGRGRYAFAQSDGTNSHGHSSPRCHSSRGPASGKISQQPPGLGREDTGHERKEREFSKYRLEPQCLGKSKVRTLLLSRKQVLREDTAGRIDAAGYRPSGRFSPSPRAHVSLERVPERHHNQ